MTSIIYTREINKLRSGTYGNENGQTSKPTYNITTGMRSKEKESAGADLGGGCRGCAPLPPPRDDLRFSNTTGILQKKNHVVYWC